MYHFKLFWEGLDLNFSFSVHFTSVHFLSSSFLPIDCDMKMISRRILIFFTYFSVSSSISYSSEP